MRAWAYLLSGLIVWTVHFFALYAIGSVFLTTTIARVLVLIVSAACLTVDAMLLVRALHSAKDEPFERWTRGIAVPGLGISLVAVTWQALPALLI